MAVLTFPTRQRWKWRDPVARMFRAGTVFWLLHFALSLHGAAPAGVSSEYQLKAVFLFNFAQFVDWPPEAFGDANDPFVIGVLGDDPFGAFLDETVHQETVNQRALMVRRYRRLEDVQRCHILFISRSEAGRLDFILRGLKGRPILTVGDQDQFANRGGMVRFITEKNKVRLRINLEETKAAGLTLSSKLLRPAQIVNGKDP